MIKAFVDTSALFAAAYSVTGASREIIRLALQGEVQLVISEDVIEEVEKNLQAKNPAALEVFQEIVLSVPFEVVSPTPAEVQAAAAYTAAKDAHVVAGAKHAQADYLVSLDRRHLVGIPEVSEGSGLNIVFPETLLREIRSQPSDN